MVCDKIRGNTTFVANRSFDCKRKMYISYILAVVVNHFLMHTMCILYTFFVNKTFLLLWSVSISLVNALSEKMLAVRGKHLDLWGWECMKCISDPRFKWWYFLDNIDYSLYLPFTKFCSICLFPDYYMPFNFINFMLMSNIEHT